MRARTGGLLVVAVALTGIGVVAFGGRSAAPATPPTSVITIPAPAFEITTTPATAPATHTTTTTPTTAAASASTSRTEATAGAAPFIQTFAAQPGVRPRPALPSPRSTLSMPVNVDGCDHAYGKGTGCVPWIFPSGVTDKCAWLADHGFPRLTVTGADRHRLDPDGNGIACDT